MDWNAAKFVTDLIAIAVAIGAWIYAWRIKHDRAWQSRIDAVNGRLAEHDMKIVTLSERQAAMPSHADLEQIHGRIGRVQDTVSDIRQSLSGLSEAVSGLRRAVDTLNQHHIGGAKT